MKFFVLPLLSLVVVAMGMEAAKDALQRKINEVGHGEKGKQLHEESKARLQYRTQTAPALSTEAAKQTKIRKARVLAEDFATLCHNAATANVFTTVAQGITKEANARTAADNAALDAAISPEDVFTKAQAVAKVKTWKLTSNFELKDYRMCSALPYHTSFWGAAVGSNLVRKPEIYATVRETVERDFNVGYRWGHGVEEACARPVSLAAHYDPAKVYGTSDSYGGCVFFFKNLDHSKLMYFNGDSMNAPTTWGSYAKPERMLARLFTANQGSTKKSVADKVKSILKKEANTASLTAKMAEPGHGLRGQEKHAASVAKVDRKRRYDDASQSLQTKMANSAHGVEGAAMQESSKKKMKKMGDSFLEYKSNGMHEYLEVTHAGSIDYATNINKMVCNQDAFEGGEAFVADFMQRFPGIKVFVGSKSAGSAPQHQTLAAVQAGTSPFGAQQACVRQEAPIEPVMNIGGTVSPSYFSKWPLQSIKADSATTFSAAILGDIMEGIADIFDLENPSPLYNEISALAKTMIENTYTSNEIPHDSTEVFGNRQALLQTYLNRAMGGAIAARIFG